MNGKVIPNTPIAVDIWSILKTPNAKVFFLSHAHSDHMTGLTSSWSEKIYCSEITAKIVAHKIGISETLLHPLTLDEPHIVSLDADNLETMTVTLIDANHCPGAVMFLFDGYFGKILYTGDFRYSEKMFDEPSILRNLKNVDDLYIDNTYCHPDCNFPSQEQARDAMLDLVNKNPEKHIVIPTNELGKENLFEEIAISMKTYIQVRPEKLELLKLLGALDVFTTDPTEERIRLIPRKFLSANLARRWNEEHPTLVIVPTALMKGLAGQTPYKNASNIHIIPYSEHSSYTELHKFVKRIRPKRLIPIVMYGRGIFGRDCKDRTNMKEFDKYLDERPRMDFVVPETVEEFMRNPRSKPKTVVTRVKSSKSRRRKLKTKGVVYATPDSKGPSFSSSGGEEKAIPDARSMIEHPVMNDAQSEQNSSVDLEMIEEFEGNVRLRQMITKSGRRRAIVELHLDTESDESQTKPDDDESILARPFDDSIAETGKHSTIINGHGDFTENRLQCAELEERKHSAADTVSNKDEGAISVSENKLHDRNNNCRRQCTCELLSDRGIADLLRILVPKPDYTQVLDSIVGN